jgi:protein-disulfide isomerase
MSLTERIKYAEMKARQEKHFRSWYKKWWGITILVISGLILIGLASAAFYVYDEVKKIQSNQSVDYLKAQHQAYEDLISGPGGYTLGSLNPKITIIEFTDFACPFCQQSATEMRELMEQYKDKIKLVVRDYPIHDTSINLALAARCAGEQGKYWEAYDSIFINQENLKSTTTIEADISDWSKFMELDTEKFTACFSERRYVDLIKRDYDDGNKLQIQGTPTWFINNYPITGYYSRDKFKELFDGILQQL